MRCIDSLVNSATIILPMDTEIFNYILIKLVSKQIIEIYIQMCFHMETQEDNIGYCI